MRLDKIDGFIKFHNKIRYMVIFDYSYCGKICGRIKYFVCEKVVLQVVLIIVLEKSELIHIIVYLLKKY